jgi:hypothetical protein
MVYPVEAANHFATEVLNVVVELAKAYIHLVKAPAQAFQGSVYPVEAFVLCHVVAFFFAAFFFALGGRPTPIDFVSQFGCLHFGQRTGLAATRLTQAWPHRRQSQTIFAGMGMSAVIAGFAPWEKASTSSVSNALVRLISRSHRL